MSFLLDLPASGTLPPLLLLSSLLYICHHPPPPLPSIPQSRLCVCTHTLTGAERWSQLWARKRTSPNHFSNAGGLFLDLIPHTTRPVVALMGIYIKRNSALDFKDRPFMKKISSLETQTSDFLIYLVLYFFPPPVLHTRPFFRSVVPLLFLSLSLLPTTKKKSLTSSFSRTQTENDNVILFSSPLPLFPNAPGQK